VVALAADAVAAAVAGDHHAAPVLPGMHTRGRDCVKRQVSAWPLQDVLLLLVVCARINRPFILPAHLHCPHCRNTIARLLGNIRPPLDLPFVCHTLFNIDHNDIL